LIRNLPVVLASGSPRRQHLLLELVEDFEIFVPQVDEDSLTTLDPHKTATELAKAKALAVLPHRQDSLVIGGDTVVALPNDDGTFMQLAKPTSKKDAERMLGLLSGKTHLVITGVYLAWVGGSRSFNETTKVTFRDLTAEEIKKYVATGEPMDKAGAYACQGGAEKFITAMDGSESNVIGLPIERLQAVMDELDK